MKINLISPPRKFNVGIKKNIYLTDCAHINLDPDEQITFLTESKSEYDVVRKYWGFYATPSLNKRLPDSGFKAGLIKNMTNQYFIVLVENGKEEIFEKYIKNEMLMLIMWLDNDTLNKIII